MALNPPEAGSLAERPGASAGPSLEAVFQRHYARVVSVLARLTGDRAYAEEIAADVFRKLSERPELLDRPEMMPWIYRVATNAGLNALRSISRRRRHEQSVDAREATRPSTPDGALDAVLRQERCRRVRAILEKLKPRDAELLLLRADGMAYQNWRRRSKYSRDRWVHCWPGRTRSSNASIGRDMETSAKGQSMNQCFSEGDWQAYFDGEMRADEIMRAEAHLQRCGECAAIHKEVAGRAERMASLMVDLASTGEILRRPSPRPQAWRWAVPVMALAAALLVVWLWPRSSVQRPEVARTPRIETPVVAQATVAQVQQPRKRAAPRHVTRATEKPDPLAGFVALDDEPIETAVIVRVTLDDGLTRADVIVGPDGRAHAIRMVPSHSGE